MVDSMNLCILDSVSRRQTIKQKLIDSQNVDPDYAVLDRCMVYSDR